MSHNLWELLDGAATEAMDKTALLFGDASISYGELRDLALSWATRLGQAGVTENDRVGTALGNSPDLIALLFAAWRIGAVVVEAQPGPDKQKAQDLLKACGVRLTVIGRELSVDVVDNPVALAGDGFAHVANPTSTSGIILTSGTTGIPKGVVLPHVNMWRNAELYIKYFGLRSDDRTCLVLPLYFGMNKIALLAHVLKRATVILEDGFLSPNTALAAMHRAGATGLCAVPSICESILEHGNLERYTQHSLRYIRIGAGRVTTSLRQRLKAAFPRAQVYLTYGLSEMGLVAVMPAEDLDGREDAVGRPIREVDVTIDDTGEILVSAPHSATGYFGDSATTQALFTEAGIRTGDLGALDPEGYLVLKGRLKDIIKSGGENVYPRDIEAALLQHPDVARCFVCGVPDPRLGEAVKAYVVPEVNQRIELLELEKFAARRLSAVQCPAAIEICESLPENAVGKVIRSDVT